KYRTYSSLAKAFLDRATIIAGESAYQSVRGLTGNVTSFVDALAAVDQPKNKAAYATELKDLIKTWKLTDYDTASVPFNLVMTTKKNQTGPKVSALQSLLKQTGQKVTVTGTYDSATKSAVTAYQKTKGLQADGEAGPLTLTALFTSLSLKSGSKGDAVTALHALLQAIGYKTDSGSTVGSATQASIKQFQTSAGLSGSGTVDKNTWTKLFMTLYPAPVPTISGGTAIGQTLTTKAGTWGPAPVELSYRWYRDGKAIANATGTSYKLTEADAGHALTVAVTGSRLPYVTVSRVSAPLNSAALSQLTATPTPVIAGSAAIGKTLTASAGTWKPAPVTLAYQWYRGTAAIAGATKPTYTVQAADAGLALQVAVTGTKAGHAPVAKTSKATAKVSALKLSATPTPTISGTAKVAVKLTAKPGTWKPSGTSLGYQWYRDGKAIKNATKASYTLTKSDQGKRITVKVTGKKSGYTTVTKTSKQTAKVAKASTFTKTSTPTIVGTTKVGGYLYVRKGTWTPSSVTMSYQWYRNGKAIKDATRSTYKVTKSDKGKRITVKATGKKSGYLTVSKTSKQTAKIRA
ncbi:MAG: peptidoglycan-binding protein, partial [Propionicimonas sp.]|nr:peptidoglycan-binding protein [Propionicimonas sp.]